MDNLDTLVLNSSYWRDYGLILEGYLYPDKGGQDIQYILELVHVETRVTKCWKIGRQRKNNASPFVGFQTLLLNYELEGLALGKYDVHVYAIEPLKSEANQLVEKRTVSFSPYPLINQFGTNLEQKRLLSRSISCHLQKNGDFVLEIVH